MPSSRFELPDYFVGQPLQKGNGLVKLEVKVLDSADHSETITKTYPVSDQSIQVNLIAEGGKLVPGMENRVFAAAMYPDGSPAANCDVKFWLGKEAKGDPLATAQDQRCRPGRVQAHAQGRAVPSSTAVAMREVELLGRQTASAGARNFVLDIHAEAKDAKGNAGRSQRIALNSQPLGENVLLRLDKAIYQAGDSMNIDVRTSAGLPTVYVDIIRGGQVMLSRWYEVKNGQATQRIDLPQNVFGSLEVHAYQMLASGEIIRDSRVVLRPIARRPQDRRPGRQGRIHARQQRPAYISRSPTARAIRRPAALGVIIVDEAVYALQELQPGLEKVYFSLQEELLKPQVQLKFSPGDSIRQHHHAARDPGPASADRRGAAHRREAAGAGSLGQSTRPSIAGSRCRAQVQKIGSALYSTSGIAHDDSWSTTRMPRSGTFARDLLEKMSSRPGSSTRSLEPNPPSAASSRWDDGSRSKSTSPPRHSPRCNHPAAHSASGQQRGLVSPTHTRIGSSRMTLGTARNPCWRKWSRTAALRRPHAQGRLGRTAAAGQT